MRDPFRLLQARAHYEYMAELAWRNVSHVVEVVEVRTPRGPFRVVRRVRRRD